MVKVCCGCHNEKLFEDFHKGTGTFGLKSQCVECCKRYYNINNARKARRSWQQRNREECRKRNKEYDATHKAERATRENFRRAKKLHATPEWLTQDHKNQMEQLYKLREQLSLEKGII